jgi:transcriptional regulator with XRE-family HTH domain
MDDFDVGARLREIRQQNRMSQRQLAEASDVPHGQISMIETNKSSPSVASLRKILGGLNLRMSDFFEPEAIEDDKPFYTPTELRDLTSRLYSESNCLEGTITLKQVGNARLHGLQILQEIYEPGADTGSDMLEHAASEGGIVITGEIEVTVGNNVTTLKTGDSYLFNSREPHRFRNVSDRQATVVSACSPPYL